MPTDENTNSLMPLMPELQWDPSIGYGKGLQLLKYDVALEDYQEQKLYERELLLAEKKAREESESSSLWSTLGSIAGAGIGLFATKSLKGAAVGSTIGGEVGKWGQNIFVGRHYDPEDYALSTDVGRFDVKQKYEIERINQQFAAAAEAQYWKDWAGTGKSLATLGFLKGDTGIEWLDEFLT